MGVFARSWEIAKVTFGVIRKDKELLAFPILAGFFSLAYIIALLFPTIIAGFLENTRLSGFSLLIFFLLYLGLAFIATFFNVCVVYTTKMRIAGGNATFMESIKFALRKIHLIFMWSLVAATVGILLRLLDRMAQRSGQAGKILFGILRSILGMAWSIITIFVVPAMVYHDLSPMDAIKKSTETLKKAWGESIVRYFGLGAVSALFIFGGIIVGVIFVFLLAPLGPVFLIPFLALVVLYLVIVSLVFGVANSVFNTILYNYAANGKLPKGFKKEFAENAFRRT